MKGIILAGGKGTRLYPNTQVISKQLLPIYDKPMIYYPIATLMEAGVSDILLISDPSSIEKYEELLRDGSQFGISISYKVQLEPNGLAQAFLIGEDFIKRNRDGSAYTDSVVLILGDNLFYGSIEIPDKSKATIFLYEVSDPERYGVAEIDKKGMVKSIVEKPAKPKSNLAVTGLYLYPLDVTERVKQLVPSMRGELEITDLNNLYLQDGMLSALLLPRGVAWLDTGTPHSMLEASNFIQAIEDRTGKHIACLEEIAFKKRLIELSTLVQQAELYKGSSYGQYLLRLAERGYDW
jgi:glucose-1-phosphate thymidylyltransferase